MFYNHFLYLSASFPSIPFHFLFYFMKFEKTSLNMFKHYKLKPSFPIIKDNKEKDRAGQAGVGGGQAPTPKFQLILI
jgi:hypothetical protein